MTEILVTGGAGYIGSHTCISLLNAGFDVIILDNLSNSRFEVVSRIQEISGKTVTFYPYDAANELELEKVFARHDISCVIHFAGKKAVGESVHMPIDYYRINLNTTLSLCNVMQRHNVKNIVFSSSATVYGTSDIMPLQEDFPLGECTNPYGWTKWMNERILRDIWNSDPSWSIHLLRYFNPVGAHSSGRIGEDPLGIPNNLFPVLLQTAVGRIPKLIIHGNDYPTPDGTVIRDYIHVMDLAEGHVASVNKCLSDSGVNVFNLGTGKGYSVMEILTTFEKAIGRRIPIEIGPRRPGDIAICYAGTQKAETELHWKASRDILSMCKDAWNWQSQNPFGYE